MDKKKFNFIEFLIKSVEEGISDIHLRHDSSPAVRKNGEIYICEAYEKLTYNDIEDSIKKTIPSNLSENFYSFFDLDYSFAIPDLARFRINIGRELGNSMMTIRMIPNEIPTFEELKLPLHIKDFTKNNNGLVLITGQTGSGKSTTLATIINHINKTSKKHIITIEDPIEFVFKNNKSVITQRQLAIDTASFPDGIKYALRQDPDVILIGEIRDRETLMSALKAAETGHLVFSTLHTNDTIQTINRIINFFEPSDRDFIRKQLSGTLRGVVTQKLLKTADGKSRVPACEILIPTPAIKDYIIKDNVSEIYEIMKTNSFNNMTTMNSSIYNLFTTGVISEEEALDKTDNINELKQMLRGIFHGTR